MVVMLSRPAHLRLFRCIAPGLGRRPQERPGQAGVPTASVAERAGMDQSTGSRPAATRAALARENGRLPKNPLRADSGEGWADSMTTWRDVSTSPFFLRADAPHRMNTTRSGFRLTA